MSEKWTHVIGIERDEGQHYSALARLTPRAVITKHGLRFSRLTGKEIGSRRGKARWRLSNSGFELVRVKRETADDGR